MMIPRGRVDDKMVQRPGEQSPLPRCCCIKDLGVGDDEEVVQRPGAQGTLVVSSCLLRAKDGKRLFVGEVEQADEAIRDRNLLELGAVDLEKGSRVSGSRVIVMVGGGCPNA